MSVVKDHFYALIKQSTKLSMIDSNRMVVISTGATRSGELYQEQILLHRAFGFSTAVEMTPIVYLSSNSDVFEKL